MQLGGVVLAAGRRCLEQQHGIRCPGGGIDRQRPVDPLLATGVDVERVLAVCVAQADSACWLQLQLDVHRLGRRVVRHRADLEDVAGDQEARHHRAQQQRLGCHHVDRRQAQARIAGHGAGDQPPGGQVIRQGHRNTRFARDGVSAYVRRPEGGVAEVGAGAWAVGATPTALLAAGDRVIQLVD